MVHIHLYFPRNIYQLSGSHILPVIFLINLLLLQYCLEASALLFFLLECFFDFRSDKRILLYSPYGSTNFRFFSVFWNYYFFCFSLFLQWLHALVRSQVLSHLYLPLFRFAPGGQILLLPPLFPSILPCLPRSKPFLNLLFLFCPKQCSGARWPKLLLSILVLSFSSSILC